MLRRLLLRLNIGQRLILGYGIVGMVLLSSVLFSLGAQALVARQISRTTTVSAAIDRLTDEIAGYIYAIQITLNQYVIQHALVGVPDQGRPEVVLDLLTAIDDDIEALRGIAEGQDDPHLTLLVERLDAFEGDLELQEVRLTAILDDIDQVGDADSGQLGRALVALTELGNSAERAGRLETQAEATTALAEARAFLIDGEPAHIGRFHNALARFRALVQSDDSLTMAQKRQLDMLAETSLTEFDDLVVVQLDFDTRFNAFLSDSVRLQESVEEIRQIGRDDFEDSLQATSAAQEVVRATGAVLLAVLLIILPLTLWLAAGIGRSITGPLSELVAATQALSEGDLSARTGIRQDDEVGSLADSFDRMAGRLATSITDARQAESFAQALADTAAAISGSLKLGEVLESILNNLERVVDFDVANIMLIDAGVARVAAERGYAARAPEAAMLGLAIEEYANLRRLVQTGQPVVIDDTLSNPEWIDRPGIGDWLRTIINVPIRNSGVVVGMINVIGLTPRRFSDEDVERLMAFADHASIAIRNAQLYEQIERHAADLEERVSARTAELEEANQQLQALSRVKDEFVANVSHELRTPITSIKLYHHMLSLLLPPEHEGRMAILDRETRRLETLVESLLFLSRLDQQSIPMKKAELSLNELSKQLVEDRAMLAEDRQIALIFDARPDLPPVQADQQLIGQVLSILLTNALNYTPSGGNVRVQTAAIQNTGFWAGFAVSDTGPGISSDEQQNLFTRFFRGKAGRDSQIAGTGLGLAIAKEIIDRHDGKIEVESDGKPGGGATFRVWLPIGSAGDDT